MKTINKFFSKPYFYIFIILFGILLKFYGLNSRFFWLDEIYTIFHTSGIQSGEFLESFPLDSLVNIDEYHNILNLNNGNHHIADQLTGLSKMPQFTPLHYVFLIFWNKVIGANYIDYRIFSLLMFFLTIPLIYVLAKKLLKTDLSALIATAFFSVSPFIHIFAQEARYYMLWFMCIVLINLVLLKALEKKKIVWWIIYTFTAILCLYVSTLSGLIIVGHFIYVWFVVKEQRIQNGISLLIIFLTYLPWALTLVNASDDISSAIGWQMGGIALWKTLIGPWFGLAQIFSHTQGFWDYWGTFVVHADLSTGMIIALVIHVLLIVMIIASFIFSIKKMETKTKWLLFLLFVPGILFFYLLDLTGRWTTFAFRYHMVNYTAIILIVAYYFEKKILTGKIQYPLIFLIIIGLGLFSSIRISKDDGYSAFGSSYGKIMAAELFSIDKRPLVISDAETNMELMGLLETIVACSSDKIDIYYTSNPQNIESLLKENKYSNVYLYQASGTLINGVKKQLFKSEHKDILLPVILADKYIDACMVNGEYPLIDDYYLDVNNLETCNCNVGFIVKPKVLPDSSKVYITGNHTLLGYWKADQVPLEKESNGNWTISFSFVKGDQIEYKFTRGTWETEFADSKGKVMQNLSLDVQKDTLITIAIENWKDQK